MTPKTVCYDCGTTYPSTERLRCDCGEPDWLATDPSGFDWSDTREDERGIRCHAGLLLFLVTHFETRGHNHRRGAKRSWLKLVYK